MQWVSDGWMDPGMETAYLFLVTACTVQRMGSIFLSETQEGGKQQIKKKGGI